MIRSLFLGFYNGRDFNDDHGPGGSTIAVFFGNLREKLRPSPGEKLLPWYKKGKLVRGRPMNKHGELCDKSD